ncbi:TrmH family RNA methyltransferase [Kangiella taiwanensis]|uniref:TrmH family RNA methyltransferase n=1 Tax=Kangiella taiwanensis TaxID=1079179 RepID=A0ABP8I354_9GAMM|nr:TrmH family RNA methyltransferase [Kangiella taiwanensis]
MSNRQLEHADHLENKNTKKKGNRQISLLAHNITVPMNVGSLFRISDALGVEKIYVSGDTPIPPNNKIRKTSRSTEKYVPYETVENLVELINRLKEENYTIIALEITSDSVPLQEIQLGKTQKVCLILGSENTGVSEELLKLSDITTHIPMLGHNSSMNVATACGIAVYSLTLINN